MAFTLKSKWMYKDNARLLVSEDETQNYLNSGWNFGRPSIVNRTGYKTCSSCHQELLIEGSFNKNKHAKDGLQNACNTCKRTMDRAICVKCDKERKIATSGLCSNCAFKVYVLPYPDKLAAFRKRDRNYRLKMKYDVAPEWYDEKLKEQDSKCAGCDATSNGRTRDGKNDLPFCVDHDHLTGEARGLLCTSCNNLVGLLEAKPVRFENVRLYLDKYKKAVGAAATKG